jgi:hypothetical protein
VGGRMNTKQKIVTQATFQKLIRMLPAMANNEK